MHGFYYKSLLSIVIFTLIYNCSIVSAKKVDKITKLTSNNIKIKSYILLLKDFVKKYGEKFLGLNFGKNPLGLSDESRKKHGKKMSGMLPVVFHMGAASTWMLLTALLAAKSVVIGLTLLVMKIALSSAKVASFFTGLLVKHKQSAHHHNSGWSAPYTPTYYEHTDDTHGPRDRSDWIDNQKDRTEPEWNPDLDL